jgi:hypothetical protein
MTLPLDGKAIETATARIALWTGIEPKISLSFGPIGGSSISPVTTHDAFLGYVEDMEDVPLPLEVFKYMMFLL